MSRIGTERDLIAGRLPGRRALVVGLWTVALATAAVRIGVMLADPILPGDPWQTATGELRDFRDIVWVPGRYLLGGGNPYDPGPYLEAHPWAQQFSAYPPVWLTLGVLLGPLPYLVAGGLFQVLSVAVAVVLLRVLCRWTLPAWADVAVPAGLLWLNLWYPARGALASLGSVVAVLGVVLVLRSLTRDRPEGGVDRACAVGIACTLLKPQFGLLVLVVALVGGRGREVWRGVVGMTLACLPLLVVVSVSAGGLIEFARSVLRNQAHVWGPDTPAGLGSPFERRFDVFGGFADFGFTTPPGWLVVAVPLAALVLAALAVRRTRDPFLLSAVVCGLTLLAFFHPWYDALILLVPVAAGLGAVLGGRAPRGTAVVPLVAFTLVVAHLHAVTTRLVPGLTPALADTADFLVVLAGTCAAVLATALHRDHDSDPGNT